MNKGKTARREQLLSYLKIFLDERDWDWDIENMKSSRCPHFNDFAYRPYAYHMEFFGINKEELSKIVNIPTTGLISDQDFVTYLCNKLDRVRAMRKERPSEDYWIRKCL
ncbi:MAG: hypothetical protein LBU89_03985 [Fibromonadaceae bacterium]|jgi:hypothetical protein|nr:hypothetical protein [Fibromonadaceae bacterium]